ncbi:MAG: hypothetical protein QOF21_185 [Actinomycetota bacterium]|jgi:hypothetical protein
MPDAELSSLTSTLDEVRRRVAALAARHEADGDEDTAIDLYEVERALSTGVRRLTKIVDKARR